MASVESSQVGGSLSSWQNQSLNLAGSSESDLSSATKFCGDDFVKSNGNVIIFYRNSQLGLGCI